MNVLKVADFFEVYANAFSIEENILNIKNECVSDIKMKLQTLFHAEHVISATDNNSGIIVSGWKYKVLEDMNNADSNRLRLLSINDGGEVVLCIEEFFDCFSDAAIPIHEDLNEVLSSFIGNIERRTNVRIDE